MSQTLPWPIARDREAILRRYADGGAPSRIWRLRFLLKRLAWAFVVRATRGAKRVLDVVGAVTLGVLLAPVLVLVMAMIRLDSPGPIFFAQRRVGRFGRPFTMYKLRSMYVDAEERKAALSTQNEVPGGVLFKLKHDPRVTRVGRFLRRTSIDELPQLWNVLRGEMSLVGPRPPLPDEVEQYSVEDRRRLEVVPGLTGLWQVSGRADIPFRQQVELDVAYIESQSLWLDLWLLMRTIPAVLLGRGAY